MEVKGPNFAGSASGRPDCKELGMLCMRLDVFNTPIGLHREAENFEAPVWSHKAHQDTRISPEPGSGSQETICIQLNTSGTAQAD